MEYNTQKYQFNQDGQEYVVSTGLVGNSIRITCQVNLALDGPFYSNEFSLDDLRHANQFFMLPQTPEEALDEINKGIERQKSALSPGMNDTIIFIGYLVIGTDNDVYQLPLRRDFEPNKYGIFTPPRSGAADLVLKSNYQVDGGRLNIAEIKNGDLQREQTFFEEELNRLIPEINKLRKFSLDIKEENALIKERLKILQDQLEDRKRSVFKLKEENEILKRQNQELSNDIQTQENIIRERQALQTTIKVPKRPNIKHGKSAITSKFEQSTLRTFLPRNVAKPITEDYIQKKTKIYSPNIIQVESTQQYIVPASDEKILNAKYLPTIYRQEKINKPIIVHEEAPDVTYSTKPNIGDDMVFSAKQYINSNPVYNYNEIQIIEPIKKSFTFTKEIPEKIHDKSYSSHYITNKDTEYTSSRNGINNDHIQDIPYTSARKNTLDMPYTSTRTNFNNLDIPYSSAKIGINNDVPYTSTREGAEDIPYSSAKIGINNDIPYSSAKIGNNNDVPYTSTRIRNNNDVPYTSTRIRNNNDNDGPYSSAKIGINNDVPYSSAKIGINNGSNYTRNKKRVNDVPYTSTRIENNDTNYTSTRIGNDNDVPYTSTKKRNKDLPYTSTRTIDQDVSYTSKKKLNNFFPYATTRTIYQDEPYTSKKKRINDMPYTSTRNAAEDVPYTSKKKRVNDMPYTSSRNAANFKESGYTSNNLNLKDPAYGSHISNKSNNEGYSSQMANNLGDSDNAGYSSQMAQTYGKYNHENKRKRPKGGYTSIK